MIRESLVDLLAFTDAARKSRAASVKVKDLQIKFEDRMVMATAMTGTDSCSYKTVIKFLPVRAVSCDCPDSRLKKIPCKHVAAMAMRLQGAI